MPTTAYSALEKPATGKSMTLILPIKAPSDAPMNSEGENTPPEAPAPRLILVAAILPRQRASSSGIVYGVLSRIDWIVA